MINSIKEKIWDLLKDREVSLVMLYHQDGSILWHRGRDISGNTIVGGSGFCKTYIYESLEKNDQIFKPNGVVLSTPNTLSGSAIRLLVKSVYIQPLDNQFYLYIDSGTQKDFPEEDFYSIKILGELLSETLKQIKKRENGHGGIAGRSQVSTELKELVLKYSLEDIPILLQGETGVGKNHMAELIHKYSGRKGKFITAHMPTIQENLFESEMFGYKKGAFTGADKDKQGLIDEAEGGTLFLDEISEVPVSLQAKLLRFIETQKFNRVGETRETTANVRIIAASNRELLKEIEGNTFREDLYYRLSILQITIPPLRERQEDILSLFEEKRDLIRGKTVDDSFYEVLLEHPWTGNVREFLTSLTRVGILCQAPITGEDLKSILEQGKSLPQRPHSGNGKLPPKTQEIIDQMASGATFWDAVKTPFLDRILNKDEVRQVLKHYLNGNKEAYTTLLNPLNLKKSEYKQFIRFLYNNDLKPH